MVSLQLDIPKIKNRNSKAAGIAEHIVFKLRRCRNQDCEMILDYPHPPDKFYCSEDCRDHWNNKRRFNKRSLPDPSEAPVM